MELSTVQYLRERTGISPDGLVVKGTEIDISALPPGDYALQIKVDDIITGEQVSEVVPFRRALAVVRSEPVED